MQDLRKLEEQYKRLGEEIEALKQKQGVEINLLKLPEKLKIIFADKTMNWHDAQDWCKAQGGRLPTKFELQALAASGQIPEDERGNYCWSSETEATWADYVWYVCLYNGGTSTNGKTFNCAVLCVKE